MPLNAMDFFAKLFNFYEYSVEVVSCYMPNTFGGNSTALLVDNSIPDDLNFSLQTQTYTITPDQSFFVGVFQGHNWSKDRGRTSAAMETAGWFHKGVIQDQDIQQIFKEIDGKALKTFKMQEGSTAAVCQFHQNVLPLLYTIGNCRAVWGKGKNTNDHDITNRKELGRCSKFFQSKDEAFHVIKSLDNTKAYQSYDLDQESVEQKEIRMGHMQKDLDYYGYTFLLRAFGH